jgi:uncharacterized protein YbaP (TraB family)
MGSLLLFLSIFLAEAHKPHLYKIQPPQQNAPCSYILGGAHVASTKQLPPIVFSLIENTSQYFVETDAVLAHIDQMTYQPVTNIKKFTPGLKTVITPEAFAEVKKYFSIYSGITDEVLNDISPEDIVLFFQVTQLFAFYHAKNEFFDLDLARFASQKNKKINALETKESLLSFFKDAKPTAPSPLLPREIAIKMLNDLPDIQDIIERESLNLIAQANSLLFSTEEEVNQFLGNAAQSPFITSRSQKWIPALLEPCKTESCFFTFGLGHLYGDLGVLNLLKSQGFQITRIP